MATFLADYGKPVINDIDARLVLANEVLLNIFQGQIEGAGGRGVNQTFSNDTSGAQIRVLRINPLTQEARELGATLGGGNFPNATEQPTTQEYGLDVITVIDQPIDIAQVSRDMIPIDLLGGVTKNIGQLVDLNLNAMTIAGKFLKSSGNYKAYNSASTDVNHIQTVFLNANSELDDGDEDNGITMFPQDDRIAIIRPSWRAKLLANGVLVVGGANYAYEILAKGVLSTAATENKMQNGYIGDFDGVPVHIAASAIWNKAAAYLGLPADALAKAIGYFSSGIGNLRGVATNEQIKIIDAPAGQGIRLQPLYRMGFNTIIPKSNVFIYNDAAPIDIVEELKDLDVTLKLKAPGSRSAPTLTWVGATATPTFAATTGSVVKALYFAVLSSGVDYGATLEGFLKGYAATDAALKGDMTSATALTIGTNGTYNLWGLVTDTDGNVKVAKSAATHTKGT